MLLPDLTRLGTDVKNRVEISTKRKSDGVSIFYPFDTRANLIEALSRTNPVKTRVTILFNDNVVHMVLRLGNNLIVMGEKEPVEGGGQYNPEMHDTCFKMEYEPNSGAGKGCLHLNSLFWGVFDHGICEWDGVLNEPDPNQLRYSLRGARTNDSVTKSGHFMMQFVDMVAAVLGVNYTYLEDMFTLPNYAVDVRKTQSLETPVFTHSGATDEPLDANGQVDDDTIRITIKGSVLTRCVEGVGYYEKRGYFRTHWQYERPLVSRFNTAFSVEEDNIQPLDGSMAKYPLDWIKYSDKGVLIEVAPYPNITITYSADANIQAKQRILYRYRFFAMTCNIIAQRKLFFNKESPTQITIRPNEDENLPEHMMVSLGFTWDAENSIWVTNDIHFETTVYIPWFKQMREICRHGFKLGNGAVLPVSTYNDLSWYSIEYKYTMNTDITSMNLPTIAFYVNGPSDTDDKPVGFKPSFWESTSTYMNKHRWTNDSPRLSLLKNAQALYFDPSDVLGALQNELATDEVEVVALGDEINRIIPYKPFMQDPLCMIVWKISRSIPKPTTDGMRRAKGRIIQRLSKLLYATELLLNWREWSFPDVFDENHNFVTIASTPLYEARKYYDHVDNKTTAKIPYMEEAPTAMIGQKEIQIGPPRVIHPYVILERIYTPTSTDIPSNNAFRVEYVEYKWAGSAADISKRVRKNQVKGSR